MRLTALWWWIDRWRKSTAYTDMTLEEQGAYRNLLDEAHLRGGYLPSDERILAKACGDALAWPRLRETLLKKFLQTPQGLINETLVSVMTESKRRAQKQADYRERRNGGGNRGGNDTSNTLQPPVPVPVPVLRSGSGSGSISDSKELANPKAIASTTTPKSSKNGGGSPRTPNSRSKRPIFSGQRIVVFDWMLEDLARILGSHIDTFDIDEWFFTVDAQAAKDNIVLERKEVWPWLQKAVVAEAMRRGLPIGTSSDTRISDQGRKNVAAISGAVARIQGKFQ